MSKYSLKLQHFLQSPFLRFALISLHHHSVSVTVICATIATAFRPNVYAHEVSQDNLQVLDVYAAVGGHFGARVVVRSHKRQVRHVVLARWMP